MNDAPKPETSIEDMLKEYNNKAPALGYKVRKSFKDRSEALKSLKFINERAAERAAASNVIPINKDVVVPNMDDNKPTDAVDAADRAIAASRAKKAKRKITKKEEKAILKEVNAKPEKLDPVEAKKPLSLLNAGQAKADELKAKARAERKATKAAGKPAEPKAKKPKKEKPELTGISAVFQSRPGSKQEKVLLKLHEKVGKKVAFKDLIKACSGTKSSTMMVVNGLIAKTVGKLMRGKKEKIPYKITKSRDAAKKETYVELSAV